MDAIIIVNYILVVVLICFSALFSGLTLGLLGLDKIGLKIVMSGDNPKLAAAAAKIAPVRENGNLLLCTLLLGNVAVNAYLSILLASISSGLLGFLISTVMIVIFGEIIPQASCSRYALQIGSTAVPVVRVLVFIMYPMTKPLSMALDYMLGDELGTIHSRTELTELLKIHVQHGAMDIEAGQTATGAITYQDKLVKDVMTPFDKAYLLSAYDVLNFKKITEIFRAGFSRIPVYETNKNDIIGVILVKDLIFVDPDDCTEVRSFIQIFGRSFHTIWPDDKLGDVLRLFKKGKSHMAIVRDVNNEGEGDPFYESKGILTIEDILEEILGDEIIDETDAVADAEGGEGATGAGNSDSQFDYSKLRLLDSGKLEYDQLTKTEAVAIGAYFQRNVKPFITTSSGQPLQIPDTIMNCLLSGCPVIDQVRVGNSDNVLIPHESDVLYHCGKEANYMIMVLTGKVSITVGKDHFRSELGPWSVIGAEALLLDNVPKFDEIATNLGNIKVESRDSVGKDDEAAADGKQDGSGSQHQYQQQQQEQQAAASSSSVAASIIASASAKPTLKGAATTNTTALLHGSPYVPDFTAHIGTDSLRYIKINRQQYEIALRGVHVWRTGNKVKGEVFKALQQNKSPFRKETSIAPPSGKHIDRAADADQVTVAYSSARAVSVLRHLDEASQHSIWLDPAATAADGTTAGTAADCTTNTAAAGTAAGAGTDTGQRDKTSMDGNNSDSDKDSDSPLCRTGELTDGTNNRQGGNNPSSGNSSSSNSNNQ